MGREENRKLKMEIGEKKDSPQRARRKMSGRGVGEVLGGAWRFLWVARRWG
jgi:hypothetical protein